MAIEMEAKVKVESHEAARSRLEVLRATPICRVIETNHIFDNLARELLESGRGLRIRTCQAEVGNDPPATMTYKGPRMEGPLKTREEIELMIDDPIAAQEFLEVLGFVEVIRFEKRRETWRVGDCTVELDEVPHLGCYVEIEGPDVEAVEQTRQALGLGSYETIRESYIALLVDHCRKNGLRTNRITF